jgi:hypothetical protein
VTLESRLACYDDLSQKFRATMIHTSQSGTCGIDGPLTTLFLLRSILNSCNFLNLSNSLLRCYKRVCDSFIHPSSILFLSFVVCTARQPHASNLPKTLASITKLSGPTQASPHSWGNTQCPCTSNARGADIKSESLSNRTQSYSLKYTCCTNYI